MAFISLKKLLCLGYGYDDDTFVSLFVFVFVSTVLPVNFSLMLSVPFFNFSLPQGAGGNNVDSGMNTFMNHGKLAAFVDKVNYGIPYPM